MSVAIVDRASWGARPPKSPPRRIAVPTSGLWLHHSASPTGGAERVRAIQRFHQGPSRGWNDIAYSFLINHDGVVFEGRGAGVAGGHTKGQNTVSHGVCLLGHFDQTRPTPAAIQATVDLVRHGFENGWWPDRVTGGHRDAPGAATSCPGRNLYPLIPEINALAQEEETVRPKEWDGPDQDVAGNAVLTRFGVRDAAGNVVPVLTAIQTIFREVADGVDLDADDIVAIGEAIRSDLGEMTDADLTRIAKAVNDERDRRLRDRLG